MPRAALAGAHPAARLIFLSPAQRRLDSILLTALSSQPKMLRWAESGVRLRERGELLGADAASHSNRFPLQRRC